MDTIGQDVKTTVGRPTLTMIVEKGDTRHFLAESLIIAAALWVAGKYLDGLLGEPIKELGIAHRNALEVLVRDSLDLVQPPTGSPEPSDASNREAGAKLDETLRQLHAAGVRIDSAQGRAVVRDVLIEAGLPTGAATSAAAEVEDVLRERGGHA